MSGAGPDLDFDPDAFINCAWMLHGTTQEFAALPTALVAELGEQRGAAGDDASGGLFGRLYGSAVDETIDSIARAVNLTGGGSETTFNAAVTFMKKDAELAQQLKNQGILTGPGEDARVPECARAATGQASSLPNVRGTTSGMDRYVWGDVYRGSPDKLRTMAHSWRTAERACGRLLDDVQAAWHLVKPARGKTAQATQRFFQNLCGYGPCLARVDDGEPLLANLPAACSQIAAACDAYADHITKAKSAASQMQHGLDGMFTDPFTLISESPALGGDGDDCGLHDAVAADPSITALGTIAHALDASRARVPVPTVPGVPGFPFLPSPGGPQVDPVPEVPELPMVPIAAVTVVPAGWKDPNALPSKPAIAPENPPHAGFPLLSPPDSAAFAAWAAGLRSSGFAGGSQDLDKPGNDANRYQYQVAGYPEKEIPIDPDLKYNGKKISVNGTMAADGVRPADGMLVDAKYVNNPGSSRCWRNMNSFNNPKDRPQAFMMGGDEKEMEKYKSTMEWPANKGMVRGLEIDTNDPDAVPYWDAMMAAHGVRGYAREVPYDG